MRRFFTRKMVAIPSLFLVSAMVTSASAQIDPGEGNQRKRDIVEHTQASLRLLDGSPIGAVQFRSGDPTVLKTPERLGYEFIGLEYWQWFGGKGWPAADFILERGGDGPELEESVVYHQALFPSRAKEALPQTLSQGDQFYEVSRCGEKGCELMAYLLVEEHGATLRW